MAQGKLNFALLLSEPHVLIVVSFGFEINSIHFFYNLQLSMMRKKLLSWNDCCLGMFQNGKKRP